MHSLHGREPLPGAGILMREPGELFDVLGRQCLEAPSTVVGEARAHHAMVVLGANSNDEARGYRSVDQAHRAVVAKQ